MRRGIRFLVLLGAPLLALGLGFVALDAASICFDNCPPESDLAATIAARIGDGAPIAVICAVPVALAWIICLVQFARAGHWGALATLALTLPVAALLSLFVLYATTNGHLLPTTWSEHNVGWDGAFQRSLALVLLWPIAIFVATFALHRDPAPVTRRHAV